MVRIEREGPVTIIIVDRPEVQNAVDRATAEGLAEAFRAFEVDPTANVAVLVGDHGTFCAGADLEAVATGQGNLAALPQAALRADRTSADRQHDLALPDAIAQELALGAPALAEAVQGAARFAAGAGRHGAPA